MLKYLVTPDAQGHVEFPALSGAVFGATAYVDERVDPGTVRWLPDIWSDRDRGMRLAHQGAQASADLARRMQIVLDGAVDLSDIPLTLDIAINLVEQGLERMLRLAVAGWSPATQTFPKALTYSLQPSRLGDEYYNFHSDQPFQWLLLRLLATDADRVEWIDSPWMTRARDFLARRRAWRRLQRKVDGGSGLYGGQMGAYGKFFTELGVEVLSPPDLVQPYGRRRDRAMRARIAGEIAEVLNPIFADHNVSSEGVSRLAAFLSETFPASRVETRHENRERYRRWFDRHPVRAFITATGMQYHDRNMFFIAECRRRGIPTVVIQHGGQYGYDARIPLYFTRDQCIPSHFISWGWTTFPGGYDVGLPTAKVVPLPNPNFSDLAELGAKPRPARTGRTLLVPLSKFRTLDPRIGGNATDGNLVEMRQFVMDVLDRVAGDFSSIVVTYRMQNFFATDPMGDWIKKANLPGLEVAWFRERPVRTWLGKVDAVLWDTAATGFLETLNFGVPTVALLPRQRWAPEAEWAERLLTQHGVVVHDAAAGVASLRRFVADKPAWPATREALQLVLHAYGRASPDYREQWRDFLRGISDPPGGVPTLSAAGRGDDLARR
jgi:hypothetical protein